MKQIKYISISYEHFGTIVKVGIPCQLIKQKYADHVIFLKHNVFCIDDRCNIGTYKYDIMWKNIITNSHDYDQNMRYNIPLNNSVIYKKIYFMIWENGLTHILPKYSTHII